MRARRRRGLARPSARERQLLTGSLRSRRRLPRALTRTLEFASAVNSQEIWDAQRIVSCYPGSGRYETSGIVGVEGVGNRARLPHVALLDTQKFLHFMKSMKSSPKPELFGTSCCFLFANKACRLAFLRRAFLRTVGLGCAVSSVCSFAGGGGDVIEEGVGSGNDTGT